MVGVGGKSTAQDDMTPAELLSILHATAARAPSHERMHMVCEPRERGRGGNNIDTESFGRNHVLRLPVLPNSGFPAKRFLSLGATLSFLDLNSSFPVGVHRGHGWTGRLRFHGLRGSGARAGRARVSHIA